MTGFEMFIENLLRNIWERYVSVDLCCRRAGIDESLNPQPNSRAELHWWIANSNYLVISDYLERISLILKIYLRLTSPAGDPAFLQPHLLDSAQSSGNTP